MPVPAFALAVLLTTCTLACGTLAQGDAKPSEARRVIEHAGAPAAAQAQADERTIHERYLGDLERGHAALHALGDSGTADLVARAMDRVREAIRGIDARQGADRLEASRDERRISRERDAIQGALEALRDAGDPIAIADLERALERLDDPSITPPGADRLKSLVERAADRIESGGNRYRARALRGYARSLGAEPPALAAPARQGSARAASFPFAGEELARTPAMRIVAQPEGDSVSRRLDEIIEGMRRAERERGEILRRLEAIERAIAALTAARAGAHDEIVLSTPLFNGRDLAGWRIFSQDQANAALTWRVADGVIRCSGDPAGYIATVNEYQDFILTFEWRWPEKPGNSGVLLRTIGEDRIWPSCLEAQLMHGSAGDFWKIGEIEATTDASRHNANGRNTKKLLDAERPAGEWNRYEIACIGGEVHLTINGEVVNHATNVSRRKGFIALQSEGAPIEFRNLEITALD